MSNTNQEVQAVEKQTAELERSRSLKGSLSKEVEEVKTVMKEVDPIIFEQQFGKPLLEHLDEAQIQLLAFHISTNELSKRRMERIEAKLDQLPNEIAEKTLGNFTDLRWLGDAAGKAVIGVGVAAIAHAVVPKLVTALKRGVVGSKPDPFADITAVETARPLKGKRPDNVSPLFAREA